MSDDLSNSINKLKFCICELFEEVNSIRTSLNNIISSEQEYFIKRYTTDELPSEEKDANRKIQKALRNHFYFFIRMKRVYS